MCLASGNLYAQKNAPATPARPAAPATPAAQAKPAPKKAVQKVAAVDPRLFEAPSAPDGSTLLRNAQGQEIRAKLISAHGESVLIRRTEDDREFLVPLSSFDEYTANQVREWIERDPSAVKFSISISATRNLVSSSSFMNASRHYKTTEWSYHIKVSNLTRNSLDGAVLEYRIIYDDEVEFIRTAIGPGKGKNQQEGQAIDLPEMAFNDEVELDTPSIALQTYKYEPNKAPREYSRDSIKGIWVRVSKNGELIGEYKSSPGSMVSLTWDNEDETEIRVKNRFRDQFTTGNSSN